MEILLGYEVKSAKPVNIKTSHLIVTGVTQLSGKTTTLESLIKRSGLKAIVFKTKVGEKSFSQGTEIPPFFRDRSDYDFVRSLIEAYAREKLNIEKGTLMKLCKGSASLLEIKQRVDETIAGGKLRGLKEEIYTRLQHYLENLIPQIQYANLSRTLNLFDGLNIMNLERFTEEAQSLIIQSVADEVLKNMREVILVIPEAWKFLPQKYNNPCKRSVESFIRQGATNRNYVWIDSQDMSGVDKIPLKQISTWILGYQTERNEVKHTLDQIAMPAKSKPKVASIMNLKKGHFVLSSYQGVKTVYVQPHWLDEETAVKVAKGEIDIEDVHIKHSLTPVSIITNTPDSYQAPVNQNNDFDKKLVTLRIDFFNKVNELQQAVGNLYTDLNKLKMEIPAVNTNEIASIVLQKLPVSFNNNVQVDQEQIISEVLKRVPNTTGVTYEVAPLEKIKKDFLIKARDKICGDINSLDDEQKVILKWIEQNGKNTKKSEIFLKCFSKSATSGSRYTALTKKVTSMKQLEVIRVDTQQRIFPHLKNRISAEIKPYGATDAEIDQVYNHILVELI